MTKRHFAAPLSVGILLAAMAGISACATATIDEAVPVSAQSQSPAQPVAASADDSRIFTDAEVDARTRELRARSGGRGSGGGGAGDPAASRDAALSRQDEVLRRIEGSGS
jgi:hypothetical protein